MNYAERILAIARGNNGVVTTAQVAAAGILRGHLKVLVDKGGLERVERGVYVLPTAWDDEFVNLQARYKKGVFSMETALFLHNLTDRTPNRFSMTFPLGYHAVSLKAESVKVYRVEKDLYELGIVTIKSPGGNLIKAYNAERTLCDIVKGRSAVDIQVVSDAFKRYAKSVVRDIPLLSEYAKKLRVEKKIRAYLEVLL